jgi:hypothetical protein
MVKKSAAEPNVLFAAFIRIVSCFSGVLKHLSYKHMVTDDMCNL